MRLESENSLRLRLLGQFGSSLRTGHLLHFIVYEKRNVTIQNHMNQFVVSYCLSVIHEYII